MMLMCVLLIFMGFALWCRCWLRKMWSFRCILTPKCFFYFSCFGILIIEISRALWREWSISSCNTANYLESILTIMAYFKILGWRCSFWRCLRFCECILLEALPVFFFLIAVWMDWSLWFRLMHIILFHQLVTDPLQIPWLCRTVSWLFQWFWSWPLLHRASCILNAQQVVGDDYLVRRIFRHFCRLLDDYELLLSLDLYYSLFADDFFL